MTLKLKNVLIVEKKMSYILKKLNVILKKNPHMKDTLTPIFQLADIHIKNILFIKQFLTETDATEQEFKDFILDANVFADGAEKLFSKHNLS